MSYLKSLTSKDIIVTPFKVHKEFSVGELSTYNPEGVFKFIGGKVDYPEGGGKIGTGSTSLAYNSIKQLYYSNYLENGTNGLVSNVGTASVNPDDSITGPRYTPNYINNIQSIDDFRYFPTSSDKYIVGVSIPSKLFGENIKPGSVSVNSFTDDGQGNLNNTSNISEGNVLYHSGLIVLTNEGEGYTSNVANNFDITSVNWESTITIYETQYKCTIRANEFNYSVNPSLLTTYGINNTLNSGSADYQGFVTGSDFSPYVTTVGLYNDNQELLAVAKLAQPLPTSQTTDTTILINLDR